MTVSRRSLLLAAPALLLARQAFAQTATPAQSRGPFYPKPIPAERDFDLVKFNGGRATGPVMELVGQVFDAKGQPLPGAIVEIWHCDAQGRYAHVGNNNGGPAEASFQGYGAVRTGRDASYRFRTIRPGVYPGRVRHIHAAVHNEGRTSLTTQMYFPDEADNARDVLLRRIANPVQREALIARKTGTATPRYVFDIRLG